MLKMNQGQHWIPRFFMMTLLLGTVFSSSVFAHCKKEDKSDHMQIQHVLMQQWNKKESPLTVAPIVVEGDHAIAGWMQGERGGRALLRRSHHGWEVYMCGGEDLTKSQVLTQAGVDAASATALAGKLKLAEQGLSLDTRKQLSIFEGVVPVESNHHAH